MTSKKLQVMTSIEVDTEIGDESGDDHEDSDLDMVLL